MRDKKKIVDILKNQTTFRDFYCHLLKYTIKISHASTKSAGSYKWNFPFIDIFPSDENSTHFNRNFHHTFYNVSKKHVYPLVLRPFGKFWLPAPKDGEAVEREIGVSDIYSECYLGDWNHRKETSQDTNSVPCKQLENQFLFTKRFCKILDGPKVCMETLDYHRKKMIYLFYFDDRPVVITLDSTVIPNQ